MGLFFYIAGALIPLPSWLTPKEVGVDINTQAKPDTNRTAIVVLYEKKLKIAVACPPVDGKANAALIDFLKRFLKVPKSQIEIISGESSREKRIFIKGIDAQTCADTLSVQG